MNDITTSVTPEILTKKRILIVEDDPFLGKILLDRLQAVGAETTLIDRGDTAWVEIQKTSPEAILLDIQLPAMDGFQILEAMRANDGTKNIPVIIISNFNQPKDEERGAKLGAQYLVKALVTPDDIVEAVRKLFISSN
ncbi:MAG: response regulator [Patescibacteria group bacterium]